MIALNRFIPLRYAKIFRRLEKLMLFSLLGALLLAAGPAFAQTAAEPASGSFAIFAQLQQQLVNLVEWINGLGAVAPIVFIFVYIAITIAFLPASVVTLGAGFVFGVVKGAILVFIGAMLGATAAFLIGALSPAIGLPKKCQAIRFLTLWTMRSPKKD